MSTSAIRSPAFPSQPGGFCPFFAPPARIFETSLVNRTMSLSHEQIGSHSYRDWPLSVFSNCQAGNSEKRRLLLDPAGIGYHDRGVFLQGKEVDISDRLGQPHSRPRVVETQDVQTLPGSGVNRKDGRGHPGGYRPNPAASERPGSRRPGGGVRLTSRSDISTSLPCKNTPRSW